MKLDLSILKAPPDFSSRAILSLEALAPLSMVAKMPGKYYRSQPEPTEMMLFALLENALGWHIAEKDRNDLLKRLEKRHKLPVQKSNVGFGSLLQFHMEPKVKGFVKLFVQLHVDGKDVFVPFGVTVN